MNFAKLSRFTRVFATNLNKNTFRKHPQSTFQAARALTTVPNGQSNDSKFQNGVVPVACLLGASFFSKKDEETPEQKLIMTLKRAIVCIQRDQYDKAEQMLHLALRMAQDQQNKDGITYTFDVMANLAMSREQFKKAEKLFVDVMRRLMSDGHQEDSMKILHISSKIAHMAQLQGEVEKALQGFQWVLDKLESKLKSMPEDPEVQELWGLTQNWFGQLLMEQGKFQEAKKSFLTALEIYTKFHGKMNEEVITMLNNLCVACTYLEDYTSAREFLESALVIVKEFPELAEAGVLKANLGLLYLKEGLFTEAKEICALAWRLGKQTKSEDAVSQAEYCLDKVKELWK